jgi:hypothetical protein
LSWVSRLDEVARREQGPNARQLINRRPPLAPCGYGAAWEFSVLAAFADASNVWQGLILDMLDEVRFVLITYNTNGSVFLWGPQGKASLAQASWTLPLHRIVDLSRRTHSRCFACACLCHLLFRGHAIHMSSLWIRRLGTPKFLTGILRYA